MRVISICLVLFFWKSAGFAQHFTPTEEYQQAYSLLLDLEFEQAEKAIRAIRIKDEQNLATLYLEDLADFLYIVTTEDQPAYLIRKDRKDERLELLESLPTNSPYRLLALGEIHLHWAFTSMRFGEYFSAASGINKAFKMLEKNIKKHPDFLPTYKSMGLLHTLVGTVPDNYTWAAKLMGIEGTIEQGVSEMTLVLNDSISELKNVKKETLFLLTFLHLNLLNDSKSLERIYAMVLNESGPLMDFAKASLLKEQSRTNEAISILEQKGGSRSRFLYLNYLLGEMKLSRLDGDAKGYLQTYVQQFKGTSYKKAAQQKIAWFYLLVENDTVGFQKAMRKVDSAPKSILDEDKSAQKEFELESLPNRTLLKCRLQFDGGFFEEALKTLINSNSDEFISTDQKLEFTYRLARIHHEMGNMKDAKSYYKLTIESGKESRKYFAANSSLMLGLIFEELGEKEHALKYFKACSDFNNSEYRNSINQKAKAGIIRIES